MAIKRTISKDEFTKLNETIKKEYKEDGDNYVLDLTDYEDPAELKRAKDREKDDKKKAEAKVKELEKSLEEITAERDGMLEGTVKKDDMEKLKQAYETKLKKATEDHKAELQPRDEQLTELLKTNVALGLASKVSNSPKLLMPHLVERITVERVDGKAVTRIKNKDGVVDPNMTVELLEKEIVANKEFAPILVGSRGSGGGSSGASGNGGAGSGGAKIDFSKSPKEIVAAMKATGRVPTE